MLHPHTSREGASNDVKVLRTIFERVADAAGTLTADAPSIRVRTHPYRADRMLNQLRRGAGAWPSSS